MAQFWGVIPFIDVLTSFSVPLSEIDVLTSCSVLLALSKISDLSTLHKTTINDEIASLLELSFKINDNDKRITELSDNFINLKKDISYIKQLLIQTYADLNLEYVDISSSDSLDFSSYVNKRSYFLSNNIFDEYDEPKHIFCLNGNNYYVKRTVAAHGTESPFVLEFEVEIDGIRYNLPLIRYAIDQNNVCHLFSIQFGRKRVIDFNDVSPKYKETINIINSGINRYRNISPSFIIVFYVFIELLRSQGINTIVIPDFLFERYRRYFRNQTTEKSNKLFGRILEENITLCKRMEYQFKDFKVESFPQEFDSYFHIKIGPQYDFKRPNKKLELFSRLSKF